MPHAPQYKVPALEKGLDILEALAADPVPQSLAELATGLDRSSSELFRMLNCLEQRNYIQREAISGKYRLSLKLYALSHTHSAVEQLAQSAQAPMQALTETVRESCHLSVLDKGRLLVISQIESPSPIRLSIEIGARFDALLTISGRFILSRLSKEDRAFHLDHSKSWIQAKPARKKKILAELESMTSKPHAEAPSDTIEGVEDLTTLVGKPQSGILAALTISRFKPKPRTPNAKSIAKALTRTATEITRTIGLS